METTQRLVGSAEPQKGLPQTAAEGLERYPNCGGFLLRTLWSKPQAGCPVQSTRTEKSAHITPGCEKKQGCYLPVRDGWECRHPLKGPMHKILCTAITLGSSRGRAEWTRVCEGVQDQGLELEGQSLWFPVLRHSLTWLWVTSFADGPLLSRRCLPRRKAVTTPCWKTSHSTLWSIV